MQTTNNLQLGLLDSFMPSAPANEFLERLDRTLDWAAGGKGVAGDVSGDDGTPAVCAAGALQDEFAQPC